MQPIRPIPFVPTGARGSRAGMARLMQLVRDLLTLVGGANRPGTGCFAGDGLITMTKTLGFLEDEALVAAVNAYGPDDLELTRIWRLHTNVWAARHALALDGDFVEMGTYKGYGAFVVREATDLPGSGKRFWLYDLFDPKPEVGVGEALREHGPDLEARVRARFAGMDEVTVIQGKVPEILRDHCPERVAYLHLDLNSADAEIGALERLWDRLSPGAPIVLDDYGWTPYRAQMDAIQGFMGARGHPVLELPTGQGLVMKR